MQAGSSAEREGERNAPRSGRREACRWTAALLLAAACTAAAGPQPQAPAGGQRPAQQQAQTAAKYGPRAVRLYLDREYVRQQPAPDFWALLPYYLPQWNESACSTASAAMLLNALRAGRALGADEKLASHADVLERTGSAAWRRDAGPGGDGVSLDAYAALLERALAAYGIEGYAVEALHTSPDAPEVPLRVREALSRNERSAEDFIIANFLQSALTADPDGAVGHFAPIAAYDASQRRALIFDPDRDRYEPYWVPESDLLAGMTTRDSGGKAWRGLLWIHPGPAAAAR